eukprot:m.195141 g.195141  ORF g.195141 m.195141 type:complete len:357 (-) comp18676_c0_seq7:3126-4196(-)
MLGSVCMLMGMALLAQEGGAVAVVRHADGAQILSTVFSEGLANLACYRIPSVVMTSNKTLIAMAEARHGSCSDSAVHEIAVRRSFDGGRTWSPVTFAVGGDTYYVGNPDAVSLGNGSVMLVYVQHSPQCEGGCGIGNGMVISHDHGATWGQPVNISEQFGPASGSLPGPGVALRTSTGRVLVVSHHSAYQRDYVSYTDDLGATWHTIAQTFPQMDEAQMTQLPNGSLMVNMRHLSSKTVGRAVSVSNDNGATWGDIIFDKQLVSPRIGACAQVCQASIATINDAVYFSNPATTKGRFDTTVRKSVDNGKTWDAGILIQPAPSAGYSCLVSEPLAAGVGGLLLEGPNATIQFASFPL